MAQETLAPIRVRRKGQDSQAPRAPCRETTESFSDAFQKESTVVQTHIWLPQFVSSPKWEHTMHTGAPCLFCLTVYLRVFPLQPLSHCCLEFHTPGACRRVEPALCARAQIPANTGESLLSEFPWPCQALPSWPPHTLPVSVTSGHVFSSLGLSPGLHPARP